MQPEWKEIATGIYWCRGCGIIKRVTLDGKHTRYLVPKREKERRILKKKRKAVYKLCGGR